MTPRTSCDRCPARYGGTDCQCSREYTRQLAIWIWQQLCSGIRSLNVGDWLAILCVLVAVCSVVFK